MAFPLPKHQPSDTENRLTILLCLREIGICTPDQLWPFVATLETVAYMPFRILLNELSEAGEIAGLSGALHGHLVLTPSGENSLRLFEKRIVHTLRERILQGAPAYRRELQERMRCRAVYEISDPEDSLIRCTVREEEKLLLTLLAQARSDRLPPDFLRHFRQSAGQVLCFLYRLAPCQPQPLPTASTGENVLPGQPCIVSEDGKAHTGWAAVDADGICLRLGLLMPDAESAAAWASAADLAGEALGRELLLILSGEVDTP